MTDRTNADAERVSDIVARLRDPSAGWSGDAFAVSAFVAAKAADIIEAQSKALAEAREALYLADGRLSLLLQEFPDESLVSDHPIATRGVLSRVQAAFALLTPTPENPNG